MIQTGDIVIDKYLSYIGDELIMLRKGIFTGHLDIKINFREGGLTHINLGVNQSVKIGDKDGNM